MIATNSLILGTANFGLRYGYAAQGRQLSRDESLELLSEAISLGYSGVDTAAAYGDSEKIIGATELPRGLAVHTKIHELKSVKSSELVSRVEKAAKNLKRAPEIVYFHSSDLLNRLSDHVIAEALRRLLEMGFPTRFGVSIYDPREIPLLLNRYPSLEAFQYPANLLTRYHLEKAQVQELQSRGIHLAVRSLLLQGILGMSLEELNMSVFTSQETALLQQLHFSCKEQGTSIIDASIKFFIDELGVSVIVGAHTKAQLIDLSSTPPHPVDFSKLPVAGKEVFDLREKRFDPGLSGPSPTPS